MIKSLPSKKLFFAAFICLLLVASFAKVQAQQVVYPDVQVSLSKTKVKKGETVELLFILTNIPKNWYVYGTDFDPDLGPLLPEVDLEGSVGIKAAGTLKSPGAKRVMDADWGGEVTKFVEKGKFVLPIQITGEQVKIIGVLGYQMCTTVDGQCVMGSKKFTLNLSAEAEAPANKVIDNSELFPAKKDPLQIEQPSETSQAPGFDTAEKSEAISAVDSSSILLEQTTEATMATADDEDETDFAKMGLMALFLLGFGAGFLAVLTPCVFPMLPMTVAFFTKRHEKSQGRKMALFYGFSIVFIYVSVGLILSTVFGATFGYAISTHWFPNLLFFVIFVIFGISFLGAFELVLPSSFVNKIDQKSDKGGYVGVFFIALTLVVISFSCTVPIVGSVAILAENGEILRPLFALLGFSVSFALPFTLFAFFPEWMKKLPKSGGWLNTIKVLFGFMELALALKFFSQADLAYHWQLLPRELFLVIWIVLSIMLGMYFLGKIKFSHDEDMPYVSVPRFFFALIAFCFGVYLIPGLWGAPLKPLAGILPPLGSQEWVLNQQSNVGQTTEAKAPETTANGDQILYADVLQKHMPMGLPAYFDLEQGLAAAKAAGKPAFLDFTGHSCANCRKMEENVWPDAEVLKRLKNEVIIISLYCDEKTRLAQPYQSQRDGSTIKTVGDQNLDIQIARYNSNAQPYYIIVDENGKPLSVFSGYKNDPPAFVKFLDKGIAAFYEEKK